MLDKLRVFNGVAHASQLGLLDKHSAPCNNKGAKIMKNEKADADLFESRFGHPGEVLNARKLTIQKLGTSRT